jgi:hypothetical protein
VRGLSIARKAARRWRSPGRQGGLSAGHGDYPSLGFGFYSTRLEDAERPGLVEKGRLCRPALQPPGGVRVSGLRHFPKQAQIMRVSQRCNCWASPTLQLLKRLESKGRLLNDPHRHHPPPRRGRRHAPIGSTPTSRSPTRRASGRFGLMRALRTGSAPQVDPARATARSFCGSSRWRRAKQGNKHTATGAN